MWPWWSNGINDKAGMVVPGMTGSRGAPCSLDRRLQPAGQLLLAYAKAEGTAGGAVQSLRAAIGAFAVQQGPRTLKVLDAVASFIADWKAPKVPLALGLKPEKSAGPPTLTRS